jgi:hypothetical protein
VPAHSEVGAVVEEDDTGRGREAAALAGARRRARAQVARIARAFAPRSELRSLAAPDTIVCRCEDVPAGAIEAGWCARQAKLYARVGMGACQGRVCGAALQLLYGWEADSVQPPTQPVLLSTLIAGGVPAATPSTSGA